jgi:hypothetical protein
MYKLILLILVFFSLPIYSQTYPKKAIINNDTVAILSIDQVRYLNGKIVECKELNEKCTELDTLVNLYKNTNESLRYQLNLKVSEIDNLNSMNSNHEAIQKDLTDRFDAYKKKSKTKINALTVGITFLLILIIVK